LIGKVSKGLTLPEIAKDSRSKNDKLSS